MCFSAEASFIGGITLSLIGIAAIRKNQEPSQRLLATMPLVFGVQQISEGFVWVALRSGGQNTLLKVAAYVFLFTALLIWPVFVPLSVRLTERSPVRRKLLNVLLVVGVLTALADLAGMIFFELTVRISGFHILYSVASPPQYTPIVSLTYLAATILALFVSTNRRVWLLGAIIALSYGVSAYFYMEYLVSVWCFFAAIVSAIVWWIVGRKQATETIAEEA